MGDVASDGADISRNILEASGEALGAALLVFDRDDTIIFASAAIVQFFPVPAAMLLPGTQLRSFLGAVYDTGVRPGTLPESSRHRPNREEWIAEQMALHWRERYENVERAGRTRWLFLRQRRLSSGIGILAVSDVSEQKKRDEHFRADLERITLTQEILHAQPNPICVKDRSLNYIAVNRAFCAIHDLSPDAMLGRSAADLLGPEVAEHFDRSDRHVLETGTSHSEAEHIVRADGSDLWVVTRKYRVGLPGRHFLVTCMNDVTDIAVWYDGSEKGGDTGLQIRDYSIFTPAQNFYDPFRSPAVSQRVDPEPNDDVPPALGALRVLLATADVEMEERFVTRLRGSGLDACAVRNIEELDAFAVAAEGRGLELDLLLLDVALPGRHRVLTSWRACTWVEVSSDMDATVLLAEIFGVCANSTRSALPKSEWGMAFDSDPVPAAQVPMVDVLVAEDNQVNQFVFAQILEGLGISHRIAADGREAVDLWHELQPALVLMDVSMPVMNGFEAAVAIREAERPAGRRTTIVAVTAQALDIDLEHCRTSGMDDHIMKPISPDMIEMLLRKYLPAVDTYASGSVRSGSR
ncbi:response regulator [Sinorhizobium medicae]|uniref:Putative PAS/PAC sensor protein n=1 Tax=Sinorhizobium medicae TaxID=110321 RepID=A0A508X4L3_9HYPH|nr:response regulator [Sinorhizobium medicae]MBO1939346.1 response regulator [Sinorhizobium medicae]MDX0423247.1 response regulator [Sinorhizobium medicae]MDX0440810.1 response regulator [Sinorhizobium medicae]MDX0458111.1 response regulator [Sinorhizobium medicae]MDX0483095.1 response regulator [Sinorhizobium medicae]